MCDKNHRRTIYRISLQNFVAELMEAILENS